MLRDGKLELPNSAPAHSPPRSIAQNDDYDMNEMKMNRSDDGDEPFQPVRVHTERYMYEHKKSPRSCETPTPHATPLTTQRSGSYCVGWSLWSKIMKGNRWVLTECGPRCSSVLLTLGLPSGGGGLLYCEIMGPRHGGPRIPLTSAWSN